MKTFVSYTFLIPFLLGAWMITSCNSLIPEDLDALGEDVNYITTEFAPTLGRNTNFEGAIIVGNTSSLPLDFKILNVRTVDGDPATELTDKFPIKVWKKAYTGEETSLAEIEAKREIQYRSILEVEKNSGNILMWNFGKSDWIRTQPDSCYLFDMEISNSGGRKYARRMRLKPLKERPYEPSQYDPVTGLSPNAALSPSRIQSLYGEKTDAFLFNIQTFVFKDTKNTSPGGSLTISVLDSMNNPIDVQRFKDTKWEEMLHGFDPVFKDGKVTYQIAYPIPLINYPTKYTTPDGSMAHIDLQFNRIGFGGFLDQARLGFDFAIYEEGHWEIQFRFRGESPKFDNE